MRLVNAVSGAEICRTEPALTGDATAQFLCRLARNASGDWAMNVIGDVDKTARDFGSLAPEIMTYMVRSCAGVSTRLPVDDATNPEDSSRCKIVWCSCSRRTSSPASNRTRTRELPSCARAATCVRRVRGVRRARHGAPGGARRGSRSLHPLRSRHRRPDTAVRAPSCPAPPSICERLIVVVTAVVGAAVAALTAVFSRALDAVVRPSRCG